MFAAALCVILVPLRLADGLWSFVHSQVPRKADLNWSEGFWIADLVIAIAGAWVLRVTAREFPPSHQTRSVTLATPSASTIQAIFGFACAVVSIVMSAGRVPVWYAIALLIAVPCVCLFPAYKLRRKA